MPPPGPSGPSSRTVRRLSRPSERCAEHLEFPGAQLGLDQHVHGARQQHHGSRPPPGSRSVCTVRPVKSTADRSSVT